MPFSSAIKKMVHNVYTYILNENSSLLIKDVLKKTSLATGVSVSSIKKIVKEKKENSILRSPKKKVRNKTATNIDDFTKCAIRRMVYNFHEVEKCHLSLPLLLLKVQKDLNFTGSKSSLRQILHNLGFRYRKTRDNRKILCEKSNIKSLRAKYLRTISKYRSEGRYISYVDETYLHAGHVVGNQWSDDTSKGFYKNISKGQRLIIVHGGGCKGFVNNALLIFKSGCKSGDYHDDMNFLNFSKWFREQYLPNLPPNSVIVVDNASYHNVQHNKAPNMSNKKADMMKWLVDHNINFDTNMLKPEIYHKIVINKPEFVEYKIDELAKQAGHTILRLPPYHPDLNPIEMIWAATKNAIAKRNTTGKLKDVEIIAREEFSKISEVDWNARCEHVIEIENNYKKDDLQFDHITENISLVINMQNDSSSDNESSDSTDSDEESDIEMNC